jgi:hypothetical protein
MTTELRQFCHGLYTIKNQHLEGNSLSLTDNPIVAAIDAAKASENDYLTKQAGFLQRPPQGQKWD